MKANKFILYFLLKAVSVYAAWYIIYDLWLKKSGAFDNWIIDNIVKLSFNILTFFGYDVNVNYHTIWINTSVAGVKVGSGCDGIELYALFAGFVLIFEGSWKNKVWFIPLGVLLIYFFNILRVIALALNGLTSKVELDFNHKYTYTIIMYMITFAGWMIWVKYFANTSKNKNEKLENK